MVVLSGAGVRLSPDTTRIPPDSFHARVILVPGRLGPLDIFAPTPTRSSAHAPAVSGYDSVNTNTPSSVNLGK